MHALKLLLYTTNEDERVLATRFRLLAILHNLIVKHAKILIKKVKGNKWYQRTLKQYRTLSARKSVVEKQLEKAEEEHARGAVKRALSKELSELKHQTKELSGLMNAYLERIGLTKGGLEAYASKYQARHNNHLTSHISQCEADRVWKGVEKVLFGDGKDLHFKKWDSFHTIGSKSSTNGIRFYDKRTGTNYTPGSYKPKHETGIEFLGLDISIRLNEDIYENESIRHSVRTCMIAREMFPSGYRYYLILTLEGKAPLRKTMGKNIMGGDPGTSTFAAVSDDMVLLEELAPECEKYNKEIARIQRQIDRSMRAMNPGNYNEDGTAKKGKHKWVVSRNCQRLKRKLKDTYRRKSAYIRCEHNERANRIIENASVFINEPTDFAALAKRSKKTERSNTPSLIKTKSGKVKTVYKYRRKGRFGKSENDRAPGLMCSIIQMKMEQYGGYYFETDQAAMKASQYDHKEDSYKKVSLSTRFKTIDGRRVQRDLYSAFLNRHADDTYKKVDRKSCLKDFEHFADMQDQLILDMQMEEKSRPGCFGF